ncbi:MAG TPA: hypothetical protein PKD54_09055 [Pirellulaceae bacterium]|nr:hypothetical protein [Pirellulaceae bacterium]
MKMPNHQGVYRCAQRSSHPRIARCFQTGRWASVWVIATMLIVGTFGCLRNSSASRNRGHDPFREAIEEMEDPRERPYIEASRPILEALVKRDYRRFYDLMSPYALQAIDPRQFGPLDDDQPRSARQPLVNVTLEQFLQNMADMEQRLGVPIDLSGLYVQSIDPDELAGRGDRMDVLFNIGFMSKEIPFDIRRASVRAKLYTQLPDDEIRKIAQELGVSEERVRARDIPDNGLYDSDEWPYLNLKFVLVEENKQLRIGYFEFLPPSLFD